MNNGTLHNSTTGLHDSPSSTLSGAILAGPLFALILLAFVCRYFSLGNKSRRIRTVVFLPGGKKVIKKSIRTTLETDNTMEAV